MKKSQGLKNCYWLHTCSWFFLKFFKLVLKGWGSIQEWGCNGAGMVYVENHWKQNHNVIEMLSFKLNMLLKETHARVSILE